jgi:hypothetical protein
VSYNDADYKNLYGAEGWRGKTVYGVRVHIEGHLESIAQSLAKLVETTAAAVVMPPVFNGLWLSRIPQESFVQCVKLVREFSGLDLYRSKAVCDRVREGAKLDLAVELFAHRPSGAELGAHGPAPQVPRHRERADGRALGCRIWWLKVPAPCARMHETMSSSCNRA